MLIKDKLKSKEYFSSNESAIADYLLNNEEVFKDLSARFIASETFTSASSVVRLCQKMGYDGFNDFKEDYLKEIKYYESSFKNIDPNYPFDRKDTNSVIINKIGSLYKETIDDTLALVSNEQFKKAADILNKARIIYVCSAGVQNDIACDFKDKMTKIGKAVVIQSRMDESFYSACYADKDCCFLIISYSGETDKILKVAKKVSENNIPAIAVTSFGKNSLSSMIDCSLYLSTREKLKRNIGSFCINISLMLLLDSLYGNCFNMNYEKNKSSKVRYSLQFEQKRNSDNPILHEE